MTMPTFRSTAETAQASGATLTITKPAGTVDGDFLIAYILHIDATSGTIAPPAGWTALFDDVLGASSGVASLYYKFAASEGADYAFTVSDSAGATVGHITCWQNVHATDPITDHGHIQEANHSDDIRMWAAYPNSVALCWMSRGDTVDATPSGFTQREKTTAGSTVAEIVTCSKDVTTAGYVGGGYTGVNNANRNSGMLVLRGVGEVLTGPAIAGWRHVGDGSSTTVLDRVYGTTDGDTLLLVVFDSTAHSTFTLGGGTWNALQDQTFHGLFSAHQSWWKIAASEAATYTHSWTTNTNDVEWFLIRIIGADTVAPIAGSEKATATGSTSLAFTGSITGNNALGLILAMDEAVAPPSWTAPSGWTEQLDALSLADATDVLGVFTKAAITGSLGSTTATGTGTGATDDKVGLLVVINDVSAFVSHQMVV